MATRTEWRLPSSDGKTQLHAVTWAPAPDESPVRAALILAHGMVEYIDRYDGFARALAARGFVVSGHDHLGHGLSAASAQDLGYFAERDGFDCLVEDVHRHRERIQAQHPGVPVFVLGHSMGSFVVRNYIQLHAQGLSGAVIVGTGHQPRAAALAGRALASLLMRTRGPRYRSALVNRLALGGLNRPFEPARTQNDFISRDERVVDRYCADPLCSFVFTVSAYRDLFTGMLHLSDARRLAAMPRSLPLLLASGECDPLGDMGKGVTRLYESYRRMGMRDVTLRLYPQDRHEVLNEPDRETVYADIAAWMERRL